MAYKSLHKSHEYGIVIALLIKGVWAMKQVTYSAHIMCMMPPVMVQKIKTVAEEDGSNMSEFIRTLVRKELREREAA